MQRSSYRALHISLAIYLVMSPLGLYNTLAMFGFVESRFVPIQIALTILMIGFAIVASQPLGEHCASHPVIPARQKTLWKVGFYVIGPPVLYAYYWFLFREVLE